MGVGAYQVRLTFDQPIYLNSNDFAVRTLYDLWCDQVGGFCGGNDYHDLVVFTKLTQSDYSAEFELLPERWPGPGFTRLREQTLRGGAIWAVAFDQDAAPPPTAYSFTITRVPEPATWAMMIAGFGMVGTASRVRAKKAITA